MIAKPRRQQAREEDQNTNSGTSTLTELPGVFMPMMGCDAGMGRLRTVKKATKNGASPDNVQRMHRHRDREGAASW